VQCCECKVLTIARKIVHSTSLLPKYSETSEMRTIWDQYKIEPFCPLLRDFSLSKVFNVLFLVQKEILEFSRMSLVGR